MTIHWNYYYWLFSNVPDDNNDNDNFIIIVYYSYCIDGDCRSLLILLLLCCWYNSVFIVVPPVTLIFWLYCCWKPYRLIIVCWYYSVIADILTAILMVMLIFCFVTVNNFDDLTRCYSVVYLFISVTVRYYLIYYVYWQYTVTLFYYRPYLLSLEYVCCCCALRCAGTFIVHHVTLGCEQLFIPIYGAIDTRCSCSVWRLFFYIDGQCNLFVFYWPTVRWLFVTLPCSDYWYHLLCSLPQLFYYYYLSNMWRSMATIIPAIFYSSYSACNICVPIPAISNISISYFYYQ